MFTRGGPASVASEMEGFKTNEFQTRRRLRLQQVREQSKDLARVVRERASRERIKQFEHADKRREVKQTQSKLVERLEKVRTASLGALGSAHDQAAQINEKEKRGTKSQDKSRERGKLAVDEVKRIKQQELDKKKEQLERKLVARNQANERSRLKLIKQTEKAQELGSGDSALHKNVHVNHTIDGSEEENKCVDTKSDQAGSKDTQHTGVTGESTAKKKDMETQWSIDSFQQWENDCLPEGLSDKYRSSSYKPSSQHVKKQNVFEVSEGMPDDLLGRFHRVSPAVDRQNKPSLTLVSEFLRTRDYRLQKPTPGFYRVNDQELPGLRESLYKTRVHTGAAATGSDDICRVVDEEAVPVPCWEPVSDCGFCKVEFGNTTSLLSSNMSSIKRRTRSRSAVTVAPQLQPPERRRPHPSPPRPPTTQMQPVFDKSRTAHASPSRISKSSVSDKSLLLTKKPSIMHYDHITKTSRDLPLERTNLVERVTDKDLDAYSLAVKESEEMAGGTQDSAGARQERTREARARQRVAQEYRDTMSYLKAVSKSTHKSKPIETAYMDDYQQNKRKINQQRMLQQEFEKVQACSKPKATFASSSLKVNIPVRKKSPQSQPPRHTEVVTSMARSTLSDAEKLISQIQSTVPMRKNTPVELPKETDKSKNTVTFDFNPSSYTYTSRIKHTPPTKDKAHNSSNADEINKNIDQVEMNNIDRLDNESSDNTVLSNCSSDYDVIVQKHGSAKSKNSGKSEVRKFIIYKLKNSSDEDIIKKIKDKYKSRCEKEMGDESENEDSVVQIGDENNSAKEKAVVNICTDSGLTDKPDQVAGVNVKKDAPGEQIGENLQSGENASKQTPTEPKEKIKEPLQWDVGSPTKDRGDNHREKESKVRNQATQPSACTSETTFKTATSDKSVSSEYPGGYVKVLDEAGTEAGKFFIGASNIPQNNPYEVIIQLKRKDGSKNEKGIQSSSCNNENKKQNPSAKLNESDKQTPNTNGTCMCKMFRTPTRENHFSSSSSTVYLSPPESILPQILKQKQINGRGEDYCVERLPRGLVVNVDVPCHHCSHSEGNKEHKLKSPQNKKHERPKSAAYSESSSTSLKENPHSGHKKGKISSYDYCNYEEAQAEENINNLVINNPGKNNKAKNKHDHKHCKQKHVKESNKQISSDKTDGSKLDPFVQRYIKELLQMSNYGAKTVKFSALHCSAISTPGSSIVNVPTNIDPSHLNTPFNDQKDLIQEKINEILAKKIVKNYIYQRNARKQKYFEEGPKHLSTTTSSDSPSLGRCFGDVPPLLLNKRQTKQKPLRRHKIKSLNISKNIVKYFQTSDNDKHSGSMLCTKSGIKISSDTRLRPNVNKKRDDNLKDPKGVCNANKFQTATKKSTQKLFKHTVSGKNSVYSKGNKRKDLPKLKRTLSAPSKAVTSESKDERHPKHRALDLGKDLQYNRHSAQTKNHLRNNSSRSEIKCKSKCDSYNSNGNYNLHLNVISDQKHKNMEKIADLTEKCTKRLSNLSKVLHEVRKNKSNMYDKVSSVDTTLIETSETKHLNSMKYSSLSSSSEEFINGMKVDHKENVEKICKSNKPDRQIKEDIPHISNISPKSNSKNVEKMTPMNTQNSSNIDEFVSVLGGIPKPQVSLQENVQGENYANNVTPKSSKSKTKPPPALYRANLKGEDVLVPHELSTVLEVDSPMSARNVSSVRKNKIGSPINLNIGVKSDKRIKSESISDQVRLKTPTSTSQSQKSYSRNIISSPGDKNVSPSKTPPHQCMQLCENIKQHGNSGISPKLEMRDINNRNEIMLKPFISIEDYARQCNAVTLDDGSNIEDAVNKNNHSCRDEEISSLNSDGTLPDIITELLKRNVLSEPFDFDAGSNLDSNGISSESNLSFHALSRAKDSENNKRKMNGIKDETSDTQSFSSKNDLEKAFKEWGMGWASSTLKKTKETLAMSTSTSSISSKEHSTRRKLQKRHDISNKKQLQSTDTPKSTTSKSQSVVTQWIHPVIPDSENKENMFEEVKESKTQSVQMQTSFKFQPPVSVKEFLFKSLADKITFSCNSPTQLEEEHFSTLHSTKMTADNSVSDLRENRNTESDLSKQNIRQRTSTPVQLFKSLTYNSSTSSYNNSNGLFSNVDDISSVKNGSSTDKDELTIPNFSLKLKNTKSDCSDNATN